MGIALFKQQLARYGKQIILQQRDIVASSIGLPDFNEQFSNDTPVQAIVQTKRGETIFDGVSTDQVITHKFCIEYIAGVTSETWVEFNGNRYDIVDVENCGEEDAILILRCNVRGSTTKEASKT